MKNKTKTPLTAAPAPSGMVSSSGMTSSLVVEDLHASVDGKEILKGVSLLLETGKVVAVMGPNGSGKSTLANVLMGHPKYVVTKGKITIDGKNIVGLSPDERAREGLFLSFQYPVEIGGVTLSSFLRASYNSLTEKNISVVEFHKLLHEKMHQLGMDKSFATRYLNEGFSGGEKKRAEILQMSILNPRFAILDETDSGLDVDALRAVASGISSMRGPDKGILLITHYNRILEYVAPDVVLVMKNGRIVKAGGKEVALQIEKTGYAGE